MGTSSGAAASGVATSVVGTLVLAWAAFGDASGWVPLAIGAVLLVGGVTLVAVGLRRAEPVLTIPPAHITFYQQHKRDLPLPPLPSASPREASADLEPMAPEDLEIHRLDVQIRDMNRKINKATVMLGTGKLSDEGYRRYVEDLKQERADLEARRVKLEMARADP